MKILLDNNSRVFQVLTSTGKQYFCNLEQLNEVIKESGTMEGYFKINHFWNNKPQKVSKKYLKELFEANQLKQDFFY